MNGEKKSLEELDLETLKKAKSICAKLANAAGFADDATAQNKWIGEELKIDEIIKRKLEKIENIKS